MMLDRYKNINILESVDKQVNSIDTDYKAEVIAAGLIEQGYDPSQIYVLRESSARRGFGKDIEEIFLRFSDYELTDFLYIKANRESIYDILPEGLFHQNIHKKNNKNKEEAIDEIKAHRLEELYARKFFQLFEIELDTTLIEAYLYEIKYDKKISYQNFIDVFLPYWPVLKLLQRKQAIIFMYIIPILHKMRNRHAEIEETISLILDVPVKISKVKLPAKEASSYFESKIGENQLGVDWVLGKSFDDGKYDLKITIGPISSKKMKFFLEVSTGNTILEALFRLFFPSDIFIVKEFKVIPQDASFILSNRETNTFLGINIFL